MVGFDNQNYKRYNIYKWAFPIFCNVSTEAYRGWRVEWYFGKWCLTIEFDLYGSLIEMSWFYPSILKDKVRHTEQVK